MQIVLYPDPVLRQKAANVVHFDENLRQAIKEMFQIMYQLKGVGLAAPQVGISKSFLVLNPTGKPEDELALINPHIRSRKGEVYGEEGCLSFPGIYAEVARGKDAVVDYQDQDGKKHQRILFSDYIARIVQHENDHLEGVLFIDRLSPADKVRVRNEVKALEERYAVERASNS